MTLRCRPECSLHMIQLKHLPLHLELLTLTLQELVLFRCQLFRQNLLFVDHDVEVLLSRDQLLVDIISSLLKRDDLLTLLLK